jgi:hypothetical protein
VVGDLDDLDRPAVAGIPVLMGPRLVGPRADRLGAVAVLEREDADPARVLLREVLDAVLVLLEAEGIGGVLHVAARQGRLREDAPATG